VERFEPRPDVAEGAAEPPAQPSSRRTLGVIGGMGPLATAAFLRTLTLETTVRREQEHLHVLIDSDPRIPDRTEFLRGVGPDPRPHIIRVARRLEAWGADLLVMPCNTADVFRDDIAAAVHVPLLSWIGEAAAAVVGLGPRMVGLLGTDGTLESGAYQRAHEAHGIQTICPTGATQQRVMGVIYGPSGVKTSGHAGATGRRHVLEAATALAAEGAQIVVLACTELSLAVSASDPAWPVPVLDPGVVVARRAIALLGPQDAGVSLEP
jgi:aspartate racemase